MRNSGSGSSSGCSRSAPKRARKALVSAAEEDEDGCTAAAGEGLDERVLVPVDDGVEAGCGTGFGPALWGVNPLGSSCAEVANTRPSLVMNTACVGNTYSLGSESSLTPPPRSSLQSLDEISAVGSATCTFSAA